MTAPVDPTSPDRLTTVFVAGGISASGGLFFNILPLLVGAAAEHYPWDEGQLGVFAASGLAGATVAALSAPLWIRRVSWRRTIRLASIAAVVGWMLVGQLDGFIQVVSCVFGVGLLVGLYYAPAIACIADSGNPDRGFGVSIFAQVTLGALCAAAAPTVLTRFGIEGYFALLALASSMPLFLAGRMPDGGRLSEFDPAVAQQGDRDPTNTFAVVLALGASLIFYSAVVGVWGFLELIGNAAQIADSAVATAITISLLLGAGGAAAAAFISNRISRPAAIAVGCAGLVLSLLALGEGRGVAHYTIAIVAMNVAWNFGLAYQIGLVAVLDISGRFTVLVTAAQCVGGVLGPLLAGLLAVGDDFRLVIAMGIAGTLLSLGLFLLAARFLPDARSVVEES